MPEPALTRARSQVGSRGLLLPLVVVAVVLGGWADSPARWRSWVHSAGVMKLSMTAAKWFLYAGIGGVVFVKSNGWMVAFGGGSLRKDGGMLRDAIVV